MKQAKRTFEVEIKTLLGSKENADKLKNDLQRLYPSTKLIVQGKQLNHYFNAPADLGLLTKNIKALLPNEKHAELEHILGHGQKMSIRTRDSDGKIIFVIKASVGDDSGANGVKRIEFESVVQKSLADLDKLLLDSGCTYQAKWSRLREEYSNDDMHVCIDKNAGYGYLAEFEKMSNDERTLDMIRKELLDVMDKLGVPELPQDRLERMFAHYNAHWQEYYGTDNIFVID